MPDFLFTRNKDPYLTVEFNRNFFESHVEFTRIGGGSLGGKAQSLISIIDILSQHFAMHSYLNTSVSIPRMIVISTVIIDEYMSSNRLYEAVNSNLPDDRMAQAFQRAELPARLVGDLYASIFYISAKDYLKIISHRTDQEKMAVIIQGVFGLRHRDWLYLDISGIARSYNYYAIGKSKPEEGVVCRAVGLGIIIINEGISWDYSPVHPKISSSFNSLKDLVTQTLKHFWVVNIGKISVYNPIKETEYLS